MRPEKRRAGRRIRKQRRVFRRASEAFANLGAAAGLTASAVSGMFDRFSEALEREEQDAVDLLEERAAQIEKEAGL